MNISLLLGDWAEVIQGKLYAQGIGWSNTVAGAPVSMGLALVIHVEYTETNKKHRLIMKLVDGDEKPVTDDAGTPIEGGFEFEVGRPPGIVAGDRQAVVLAANLQGIVFKPGRYTWALYNGDDKIPVSVTFTAR